MSYLLNHIDNNRSEDDEDDHIKELFPKCNPKAFPLSLSPPLQYITNNDSENSSDISLNTYQSNNKPQAPNNLRNQQRNSHQQRRFKPVPNSPNDSGINQDFWGPNDVKYFAQSGKSDILQENNNLQNYFWIEPSRSLENLNNSIDGYPSDNIIIQYQKHSKADKDPIQPKSYKVPPNKKQGATNGKDIAFSPSSQSLNPAQCHTPSSSSGNSSSGNKSKNNFSKKNFSSTASLEESWTHEGVGVGGGLCAKKSPPQHHPSSLLEEKERKMEPNSIEDNFDNGIGSGCSRSSGESSQSNTSGDFMVSPVASIRSTGCRSVASGNGGTKACGAHTTTPSSIGSLRDSRIEIAGGREIYSQNRIRASRRFRGSGNGGGLTTSNEIISDVVGCNKIRKKSIHSHPSYQHHHCCHTNSCCGSANNCGESVGIPHGSIVWEPNHSGCRRTSAQLENRAQYLSHSHSFGGTGCVKSSGSCGCCGHHGLECGGNGVLMGPPLMGRSPPTPTSHLGIAETMFETMFAAEVRTVDLKSTPPHHRRASLVRSPEKVNMVLQCESPRKVEPLIYEAPVLRDVGGKVVFDDIGEWREGGGHGGGGGVDNGGYEGGDEHDTSESHPKKRQLQQPSSSSILSKDKEEISRAVLNLQRNKRFELSSATLPPEASPCASHRDGNTTPSGYESDECSASACTNASILSNLKTDTTTSPNNVFERRVIGSIPIAEYEGSPKRYGLKQSLHPVTTHFDLIDVDMVVGGDLVGGNTTIVREVINEPGATSLVAATSTTNTAATSSSSSSSLDNTNTNISSNSSSRANNRTSPRVPSPSNSFQQTFSRVPGFLPGFPQRVNESLDSTPPMEQGNRNSLVDHRDANSFEEEAAGISGFRDNRETSSKLNQDFISCVTPPSGGQGVVVEVAAPSFEKLIEIDPELSKHDSLASDGNERGLVENNFLIDSNEIHPTVSTFDSRNQDFLYEFSETRKVLEEFFNMGGGSKADAASFDELDYMLKRQTGNSYVGQRLATDIVGNLVAEDSPKKPHRRGVLLFDDDGDGSDEKGSPKLISFQEILMPPRHASPQVQQAAKLAASASMARSSLLKTHSSPQSQSPPIHDPTTRDINDNDIDAETASTNTETDLGETEVVGLHVRRGRSFAVSPETTDCDELESELSLDYEASLAHPSCRPTVVRGINIPVIEDCLSSGNESENEDIIEVDVGYRGGDCYMMGNKIKQSSTSDRVPAAASSTDPAKLYPCEENKENIHEIGKNHAPSNIRNWSEGDFMSLQEEHGSVQHGSSSGESNQTWTLMKKQISEIEKEIQLRASQQSQATQSNGTLLVIDMKDENEVSDINLINCAISTTDNANTVIGGNQLEEMRGPYVVAEVDTMEEDSSPMNHDSELDALDPMRPTPPPSPAPCTITRQQQQNNHSNIWKSENGKKFNLTPQSAAASTNHMAAENVSDHPASGRFMCEGSRQNEIQDSSSPSTSVTAAIQDIKEAIQRVKSLPQRRGSITHNSGSIGPSSQTRSGSLESPTALQERVPLICDSSPVWVPRNSRLNNRDNRSDSHGIKDPLLKKQRYDVTPDDDADTDEETSRLLGQTRTEDDCGFYDEKDWKKPKSRSLLPSLNKGVAFVKSAASTPSQAPLLSTSASISSSNGGGSSTHSFTTNSNSVSNANNFPSSSSQHLIHSLSSTPFDDSQVQLPNSTGINATKSKKEKDGVKKKRSKEDLLKNPTVLIEGVLFRAKYLGSTQLTCEGQPTKATRMMQAEEAVSRIKDENSINEVPISVNCKPPATFTCSSQKPPADSNHDTNAFANAADCALNNIEDEQEEFCGVEDDESSCEGESDMDEDLFAKTHHSRGSVGSPKDNKGMRLPLENIHGSSNFLQIHDNAHSLSLHHNNLQRNGEVCSSQPSFLNPHCGSALPGTMFRLRFIGSLEVDEEIGKRRRKKRLKRDMVEEAVMKLKAPEGETQPSTEVDLFISTEKIMVLNTDLKEIMMDHALRTISYIADIGDLVVLMARRRPVPTDPIDESKPPRPPKMICHVFESDEAQYIAQSIGQAFQVAYMEFLKANGIEDSSFVREMDYQEVLNSQEIFGDELQMFAKKELQKEVVVPKTKGEILGVVIVESGWGSMLPTVVIANLAPAGAAARCGQLNIGDQIIAINGVSLVGLPLSTCQNYIKNTKNQTVVKLTVVPCPPVVEVKIKRPDTKYQLGFSVQNGVICSLLRGGIAERGGVRVGHRIIEINSQSVVAVPHEKIVNLLATSVGEINMKTMPTSMFRLLTGQETPLHI